MHTTCYLVHARTPLSHMCVCTSHLYIMKFVVHFSTLHIPYYLQIYQVHVQRCTSHFCSLRSVFLLWTKIFTTTCGELKCQRNQAKDSKHLFNIVGNLLLINVLEIGRNKDFHSKRQNTTIILSSIPKM